MKAFLAVALCLLAGGLSAQAPVLSCCVSQSARTAYQRPVVFLSAGTDSLKIGGAWTRSGGDCLQGRLEQVGDTLTLVLGPDPTPPDSGVPGPGALQWEATVTPLPRRSFVFAVVGQTGGVRML